LLLLAGKLQKNFKRISNWVAREIEERSHYIAGKLAHDLASPFQVVYLSVQEIVAHKNSSILADERFCTQLLASLEKAKAICRGASQPAPAKSRVTHSHLPASPETN
jgi:hypothetical protein